MEGKSSKRKAINTGAPSQKAQPTRKGKKAWRKNVDIADVEHSLEGLREEERVTGGKLQDRRDSDLFSIDVVGNEHLRAQLKAAKKPLRFQQILAQRSAIPAVHSRPQSSAPLKAKISMEEKGRLLRKTKRLQKGAFNSYIDPTEAGSASFVSRVTGEYDVWDSMDIEDERIHERLKTDEAKEYIGPLVQRPKFKAPESLHPSRDVDIPAITTPHPGISYNPSVEAHQELLRTAHEIEVKREEEAEKWRKAKAETEALRAKRIEEEGENYVPYGQMLVDIPGDDDHVSEEEEEENAETFEAPAVKKAPKRKTSSQKHKAARLHAEKHALAEKARRRQQLNTLNSIKSLSKSVDQKLTARQRTIAALKLAQEKRSKESMAGKRLGKHIVKAGEIDVQLGEELTESLRELKPEGNLFRDRFLSLQHRALVEPREPVLPKRKSVRYKEYEKHPFKRFT